MPPPARAAQRSPGQSTAPSTPHARAEVPDGPSAEGSTRATQSTRTAEGYSHQDLTNENLPTPTPLVPELRPSEKVQVARRTAISAVVVHEAIREEGERELERPILALAASGLAAGLSMGFSVIAEGLLVALLPTASWTPVIASAGYSIGFIIVVLGRQQLFTENTLTVMLPLLAGPSWHILGRVARLWGVVLLANLVGAFIVATVMAHTGVFAADIHRAFVKISLEEVNTSFGVTVMRGVFAGWLIALMVWLLPSAENARLQIILIITYVVALGRFTHIIAGSVSTLYLVSLGKITWATCLGTFLIPTLIGNIIGGVSLVAALNFAQVSAERAVEADAPPNGQA